MQSQNVNSILFNLYTAAITSWPKLSRHTPESTELIYKD